MAGTPGQNTEFVAWFNPTCPYGVTPSAPNRLPIPLGNVFLWRFEVRIPPGHAGVTGIALTDSGSFIVPYAAPGPAWLIGDDDLLQYPLEKQVGNSLALVYYNTSTQYNHGWQVRIVYTPISVFDESEEVIVTPNVTEWLQELRAEGE